MLFSRALRFAQMFEAPSSLLRSQHAWLVLLICLIVGWSNAGAAEVHPHIKALVQRSSTDESGRTVNEQIVSVGGRHSLRRIREVLTIDADGKPSVVALVESVADQILVTSAIEVDARATWGKNLPKGSRIERQIGASRTWIVSVPADDLATRDIVMADLSRMASVAAVDEDTVIKVMVSPGDASYGTCWGLNNTGQSGGTVGADIGAEAAWNSTIGSRAVRVGIIDTGVDYRHPDLAANIWTNSGESGTDSLGRDKRSNGVDDDANGFVDDWHGWDFSNDDNDPMDDHGHGTHCAGIVGAEGGNSIGVAGVCWQVSLVPIKFANSKGYGFISDAIAAIDYARQLGLPITSNSWATPSYSAALNTAIGNATATGMLFVAASGNSNTDNDSEPFYPASFTQDGVISVAATDRNDLRAAFSCYGATSVDLGAPGADILSCQVGGGYQALSGTSMAAPFVAGACALLKSIEPGWTAAQIKASLLNNADPVAALAGKTISGGRLSIGNSVLARNRSFVRVKSWTFSDSPANGATGNGDGHFVPGETVAMHIVVSNTGTASAHGVAVDLTTASANGEILVGHIDVGDLSAGAESSPATPFLIHVYSSVIAPMPINCHLIPAVDAPGNVIPGEAAIPIRIYSTISGQVTTMSGGTESPSVGTTVTLTGTTNGTAVTDSSGAYSFLVPNGIYLVETVIPGIGTGGPVRTTTPPNRIIDFRVGVPGLGISPASLAFSAPEGGTGSGTITLSNNGTQPITASFAPRTGGAVATTGLWHQTTQYTGVWGTHAWYYGVEAQHSYDTGSRTAGTLTLKDIYVPPAANLRWMNKRLCEDFPGRDLCTVQVSRDLGESWQTIAQVTDNSGIWANQFASLAAFASQWVWIRFGFDSIDGVDNDNPGWLVDFIRVTDVSGDSFPGFLSVEPASSVIPVGGSVEFVVTADTEGVYTSGSPVVHDEVLSLAIADGADGSQTVPVAVTVQPAVLPIATISTFFDTWPGDDGDGFPEAGETVRPSILFSNLGGGTLASAQITLSITDPYVTTTTDFIPTFSLTPYQNKSAAFPLLYDIHADCPANHVVQGLVTLDGGVDGLWEMPVSFVVRPTWALTGRITDGSSGLPLAGVTISNGMSSAVSDAAGDYTLPALHPGNQTFIASKSGYGSIQMIRSDESTTWDVALFQPQVDTMTRTVDITVTTGLTQTVPFSLPNNGTGTLVWSLCQSIDSYDVTDSRQPDGPAVAWIEISKSGRIMRELLQSSSSHGPCEFGMPVPFFDSIVTHANITPYGYLSLTSTSSTPSHLALPSLSAPPSMIAWQWQFEWYQEVGKVFTEMVDPDTWIVQEDRKFLSGVSSLVTSQMQIARDGTITCVYRTLSSGINCTVGIQDESRTKGSMYTSDGSGLSEDLAVEFRPHPTWLRLGALHGESPVTSPGSCNITGDASSLSVGNYSREFSVVSNAVDEPLAIVTVNLHVVPLGAIEPLAIADAYDTDEDTPLSVVASGILGNDIDPAALTLTAVLENNPSHGTLILMADGGFTYSPAAGFSGDDVFTYHATNGSTDSLPTNVTITVNSVTSSTGSGSSSDSSSGGSSGCGGGSGLAIIGIFFLVTFSRDRKYRAIDADTHPPTDTKM